MSNRTSGEPRSSPQTFIRMTFFGASSLLNTKATILRIARSPNRNVAAGSDNPADCAGGGAGRDRTDDILLAKQALSQLSYGP